MTDPAARPGLWMLAGALAFAVMGALTHAIGARIDWMVAAWFRASFMFVAAVLLARSAGVRLAVWDPPTLWTRSLAGSFSLVCNFYALSHLPVAEALTLSNTQPLWIALLSVPLLRQAPSMAEVVGVTSGLAGVALIQRPDLEGDGLAAGAALLGALSAAVAMMGLHRLRGLDPRAIVAHFAGVASLVASACLVARPESFASHLFDPVTIGMLLAMAGSGTVGQFLLTRAYSSGPPARMAVIGLVQVVFALGFDVALWHRAIPPATLIGIALVMAPAAWLAARHRRRLDVSRHLEPEPATA